MNDNINTLEANLVVIGGGGSGLTAAVTAAEKGITGITVLEKQGLLGGNSAMAMGFFACDSPVQKAAMIDCRADDCFKIAMDWAHWTVDPRIVRAYFDKSGDTVRWLESKGFKFSLKLLYPNQKPVWHIPEGNGARIIKVLAKDCEDMGIKVLCGTGARKILLGDNGEITGVVATGSAGQEITIKSRSVLVATGGFTGNKELLKKYCRDYHEGMLLQGKPLDGDGLALAAGAGAAIADTIPLLKIGGHLPASSSRKAGALRFIIQDPYTVWLNKGGRRFIDETASFSWDCINAILRQPDHITYSLFDDRIREEIEKSGTTVTGPHPAGSDEKGIPGLENLLKEIVQEDNNVLKVANTWDEIAGWMDLEPEVLKSAVDEYNFACDSGHDRVFVKDRKYLRPLRTPPFYAVRCCTAYHETLGGIKTNERMEVINAHRKIIPGLYVAGVIADDWVPESYWSVLCGSAFGFALNSGRIAGENIAGFIKKQ